MPFIETDLHTREWGLVMERAETGTPVSEAISRRQDRHERLKHDYKSWRVVLTVCGRGRVGRSDSGLPSPWPRGRQKSYRVWHGPPGRHRNPSSLDARQQAAPSRRFEPRWKPSLVISICFTRRQPDNVLIYDVRKYELRADLLPLARSLAASRCKVSGDRGGPLRRGSSCYSTADPLRAVCEWNANDFAENT
ncbi:hypothetical protein LSAT2_028787 [Lamellibrachia satsuma]|nr:hypothetical protein LSAT2_028787 [Lamellibrachia satsuma]